MEKCDESFTMIPTIQTTKQNDNYYMKQQQSWLPSCMYSFIKTKLVNETPALHIFPERFYDLVSDFLRNLYRNAVGCKN